MNTVWNLFIDDQNWKFCWNQAKNGRVIGIEKYLVWAIGLMSRVFANGPGDRSSILCRVIPKTQKLVLDVVLLNTQHYKVRIKGKVEQSREWSSTLPLHLGVVAIEKGAFGSPSTEGRQLYLLYFKIEKEKKKKRKTVYLGFSFQDTLLKVNSRYWWKFCYFAFQVVSMPVSLVMGLLQLRSGKCHTAGDTGVKRQRERHLEEWWQQK